MAMRIAELLPHSLAVRSAALIARKAGYVDWVRNPKRDVGQLWTLGQAGGYLFLHPFYRETSEMRGSAS